MIAKLQRYARAFVLALGYTLRGEKPPLLEVRDRFPACAAWWEQTLRLVEAVEQQARANNVDPAALMVHADKRDTSMSTILAAIRYHAQHEYPYVLARSDPHSQITVQALNINDRYLAMRLAESLAPVNHAVKTAVDILNEHLGSIPTINATGS